MATAVGDTSQQPANGDDVQAARLPLCDRQQARVRRRVQLMFEFHQRLRAGVNDYAGVPAGSARDATFDIGQHRQHGAPQLSDQHRILAGRNQPGGTMHLDDERARFFPELGVTMIPHGGAVQCSDGGDWCCARSSLRASVRRLQHAPARTI